MNIRRLTLALFMLLAPVLRLTLDIPYSWSIPVTLFAWVLATFPFGRYAYTARDLEGAYRVQFAYFVFEVTLTTYLIWEIGGMSWLGSFFYIYTIVHASMFLPRRQALIITGLASSLGIAQALAEWHGWIPVRNLLPLMETTRHNSRYMFITIMVMPVAGYWSVGLAVGPLAEVLRNKARRLQVALEEERELRIRASTDSLTGLYNHSFALNRLLELLEQRQLDSAPLAVAMIDIDGFKAINDRSGHLIGDQCLLATADAMRTAALPGDILGRYGGDEFLAILPASDGASALAFAERVLNDVQSKRGRNALRDLSISIGVSAFPADGRYADDLISRADERMYEAKRLGGDRICVSPAVTLDRAA